MTMHSPFNGLRTNALASALAAVLCTTGINAYGQDADSEEAAEDGSLEELVVTGTRIRRDDFSSPNATSVVTAEDMRNLGVFSVADMMQQLPNNVAAVSPEMTGDSAFFVGSTIANLRGLNTFFGTRTLTLVDSKRFVSTNNGGGVDLNFIPSALVGRIETVTGGASASYGADALAGVVNVILDDNMEGVRIDLGYGETGEGDGALTEFSIAGGTSLLDDRGQFTFGIDHSNQEAINDCTTREFCQRSLGYFENGQAQGGFFTGPDPYDVRTEDSIIFPGLPHYVITEGMRFTNLPTGILMGTGTDPQIWTFNEAGNDIVPIYNDLSPEQRELIEQQGTTPWDGVTPFGIGGLQYAGIPLLPETQRDNFYSKFAYEMESGTEVTFEASYGKTDSTALQSSFRNSYNDICVRPDNGFLLQSSARMQEQIAARISGAGTVNGGFGCFGAPFLGGTFSLPGVVDGTPGTTVTKDLSEQIDRQNNTNTDVSRFVIGANGDLFAGGSWTWDAYFQYGFTDRFQTIADYPSQTRQEMAKDAVIDDNTGEVVCRVLSTDAKGAAIRDKWRAYFQEALGDIENQAAVVEDYLQSLSAGCQPINFFGLGMSDEAKAFAYPNIVEGTEITLRAASLSFSGDAWRGIGAGPLRMAAGIDTRQETTRNFTGDDPITARDFTLNYGDAWAGRTTNLEAFVEFELPLLRDRMAADYLMVNLASRRTQNETERLSGDPLSVTRYPSSWKASMVWQPADFVRVRLTRSTDTRAPAPRELYQTNTAAATASGANEVNNPFRENLDSTPGLNDVYDRYQSQTGGNADLEEETAISETFGIVFTPEIIPGLQASVDYYETTVKGGIETVGGTTALLRCAQEIEDGIPEDEQVYCKNNVVFGPADPAFEGLPGYQYSNVETLSSSQENVAPYWSRGVDYSLSYFKTLAGGGSLSGRFLGTRFLEQSVDLGGNFGRRNVAGQTGSNGLGSIFGAFGNNYSPTPNFSGNLFVTYAKDAFSVTTQFRYVGTGQLYIQDGWIGPGESGTYYDNGEIMGPFPYDPNRELTVSDSTLPSWTTVNVNFNYDFGRSQMALNSFESLSAYLNITNIGDRTPEFFSGRGAGGINPAFFSGMGRELKLGVRMEF